ncbi:DHRSX [Mytilus edulis]|uniref:DHRSX n=1 Tax=Mytilus edulis TaxID=6550 RepID=A0A8S3RT16_MYTED|nr:DHRSX [Mytilus edulis]
MKKVVCFFFVVYSFLKIYIYGAFALLRQILQTHKKEEQRLHTGYVAIVTGGSAGIGFEVSRGLVSKNVHVVIGSRCIEEGKTAVAKIREEYPNAKVDWLHIDLTSLKSVREFTDSFLAMGLPLNILINNDSYYIVAGIMFAPYQETDDGLEEHFQVNYLSHFYLTLLLLDVLKKTGTDNSYSRIINVSSVVHKLGNLDIDRLCSRYENSWEYSPHAAYSDSKLAITVSSFMLGRKLNDENYKVTANVLHPGVTPEMAADTVLYLALSPNVEGDTGSYYDNCVKNKPHDSAHDRLLQEQLWHKSCEIIEHLTENELKHK